MSGLVPSATWFDNLKADRIRKNPGDVWHLGDTYNMGIGQGFNLATPLQMVNIAATIANGGTLYRPRIIQQIVGRVQPRTGLLRRAGVIQPFAPSIIRRNFLSAGTIHLIQQGMHESVTLPIALHGTSFNVTDPRIDAAGKTGTAEDHTPSGRTGLTPGGSATHHSTIPEWRWPCLSQTPMPKAPMRPPPSPTKPSRITSISRRYQTGLAG